MKKTILIPALSLAVFVAIHPSVQAASASWNVATGGNWDDANNWTPITVPNGIGETASFQNFTTAGAYNISASTVQTFTVGALNLSTNAGATTNDIDLSLTSNVGLIFDATEVGTAQLNFATNNNAGSTITVNSAIQLNDNLTSTVTRAASQFLVPVIAGNVNLQGNTWNIGSMNSSLRFNGLISGAGSINAGFADHGSMRDTTFTNTASTFSGGVTVGRNNRIGLNTGSVNFTGTGGGGILGTGTISAAANSTINDGNAATLASNGAFFANDADTTTNVLANNIDVAAGRFLRLETGRPVNYSGNLSGTGTLVKVTGANNGSRSFAINSANTTFAGTVEIQDGQIAARVDNALGSLSTIRFNPTSNANGVGLFGSTVSSVNSSVGSTLEFQRTATGNSQFITTAGNSTFTLSGNFSNTGAGVAGYIGLGRGNGVLTNVGGGYALGTNTGVATIRLTGTGSLENNIGIVDGSATASALSLGNTSGTQTFTGIISGNGDLVRNGAGGTSILSGANTYTGTTTVTSGTLIANNGSGSSATGTGTVSVASGATLGGSGFIAGDTTVNGTLAPGNSPGLLTFTDTTAGVTDLTLTGTAISLFEIT
ncbi:MAG TPA: hypothetical protein VF614_15015, partial [Chthoniobacteraceae bacterium]